MKTVYDTYTVVDLAYTGTEEYPHDNVSTLKVIPNPNDGVSGLVLMVLTKKAFCTYSICKLPCAKSAGISCGSLKDKLKLTMHLFWFMK